MPSSTAAARSSPAAQPAPSVPRVPRPVPWLVLAAAWLYTAVHFVKTGVFLALQNFYGDFLSNFPAHPVAWWAGRLDLYHSNLLVEQWMPPPVWSFAPGMHIVTFPLLTLPTLPVAYNVWLVANYGFIALAGWLLYRVACPPNRRAVAVTGVAFIMLNHYPLYEALLQRTIEICELAMVAAAMWCVARRRQGWAGGLIGFAAMTKYLPAIFLASFFVRRQWRALAVALAVIVVLGVGAQATLGWQHNFVTNLLLQGEAAYLETYMNQSLSGFMIRVTRWLGMRPYAVPGTQVLILTLGGLLGAFLLRLRGRGDWRLEWGLLAVAMIMLLPHNQNYYLIFLLVPYVVLWGRLLAGHLSRGAQAAFAASYVLTALPVPMSLLDRLMGCSAAVALLDWSVPTLGVALLVGVLVRELARSARDAAVVPSVG